MKIPKNVKVGDYVLVTMKSNLSISGFLRKIIYDESGTEIYIQPDANAPLFLTVKAEFLSIFKKLNLNGEEGK